MSGRRALVVGGGIGGLTTALCLTAEGWQVTVLEQAPEISEFGAGLQVSPNAVRVLDSLELLPALQRTAVEPRAITLRHYRTGNELTRTTLGDDARRRWGMPYLNMHRGDLVSVLASAAAEAGVSIVTDAAVSRFDDDGDSVTVFANGERFSGDVVIGADGIHSVIGRQLFGDVLPRYTGHVAYRFLAPTDQLPATFSVPEGTAWLGPHAHLVHYLVRGGKLVNCICVVEEAGWQQESWTEPAESKNLRVAFSGWHETVQSLIHAIPEDTCFRWALHDRLPMPAWHRGRVTLLGDACHATLPFMAQGAAMAIEDAQVLANCLSVTGSIAQSLSRYETLRQPRTRRIQKMSRRNGTIYHLSGLAAWARDRVIDVASQRTMDTLYRYDAVMRR